MKNSEIVRKFVAWLFIATVAVCTFGCSDKKKEAAISSIDLENAFSEAAKKYGYKEIDWDSFKEQREQGTIQGPVFSSTTMKDDDAEGLFYSFVGLQVNVPNTEIPEISKMSLFYMMDSAETIRGHYIIFENEKDCVKYRDLLFKWFGETESEEKGFKCFSRLTDERMNALYYDGNTMIWFTAYLSDTPVALRLIYDKLGLSFPEKTEES